MKSGSNWFQTQNDHKHTDNYFKETQKATKTLKAVVKMIYRLEVTKMTKWWPQRHKIMQNNDRDTKWF